MAIVPNSQRVPLARSKSGEPVLIEREWLRFFTDLSGATSSSSSTTITDPAALAAINALTLRVTLLEQQVAKLMQGYHV
jgi:hypothetical protein